METWYISIGFSSSNVFSADVAFDMSEQLDEFAAVMSVAQDMRSGSVALTVDSNEWQVALDIAHEAVVEALALHEVSVNITSVEVKNQEEFQKELYEPVYPEVVGFAEIARLAGVSRQRVRQLSERANFARPVIRTAQGPLYSLHAVQRWVEARSASSSAQANSV